MKIKKCNKCKLVKEFYNSKKHTHCKDCMKEYFKNNQEIIQQKNRVRNQKKRDFIASLKNSPCSDCGLKFPSCAMDFDHLPERGEKKIEIALAAQSKLENLLLEIAKCELVCSNCHRLRTFNRNKESKLQD